MGTASLLVRVGDRMGNAFAVGGLCRIPGHIRRNALALVGVAVATAMLALPPGPAAAQNLIVNPGFETGGFTGWVNTSEGFVASLGLSGCCSALLFQNSGGT